VLLAFSKVPFFQTTPKEQGTITIVQAVVEEVK
jgi:hypothetical protein